MPVQVPCEADWQAFLSGPEANALHSDFDQADQFTVLTDGSAGTVACPVVSLSAHQPRQTDSSCGLTAELSSSAGFNLGFHSPMQGGSIDPFPCLTSPTMPRLPSSAALPARAFESRFSPIDTGMPASLSHMGPASSHSSTHTSGACSIHPSPNNPIHHQPTSLACVDSSPCLTRSRSCLDMLQALLGQQALPCSRPGSATSTPRAHPHSQRLDGVLPCSPFKLFGSPLKHEDFLPSFWMVCLTVHPAATIYLPSHTRLCLQSTSRLHLPQQTCLQACTCSDAAH